MNTGDIAELIFELFVGLFALIGGFITHNDTSKGARLEAKYRKQFLITGGVIMIIIALRGFFFS